MSNRKGIAASIAWVILLVIVIILVQIIKHARTEEFRAAFRNKIAQVRNNISFNLRVSRRPPLSTVVLEQNIKRYLREPFASFSRDEWNDFWQVLYGKFPDESSSWPRRIRQLTKEEAEYELTIRYSNPFSGFRERHWGIFWQHVLQGKVFR